jgi:branched-chain amino acid transport system substrate-binding protein
MKSNGGKWPTLDNIIDVLQGMEVTSLGGKGGWRKDKIADQTFVQGFSTHKNKYDFVTLSTFDTMYSADLQKPPGANFWEWIKTANFKV